MALESQSLKEKSCNGVFGDVYELTMLPKEVHLMKDTKPTFEIRQAKPTFELQFQVPNLTHVFRVISLSLSLSSI